MGSRMARNLLREFPLVACDSSRAAVEAFVADAAAAVAKASNPVAGALSVGELFEKARELGGGGGGGDPLFLSPTPAAVLTSLPSPAAVRGVYLGEKGLIRLAAEAAATAAAPAAAPSRERNDDNRSNNEDKDESSPPPTSVLLVELSTIDPRTAMELSDAVEDENNNHRRLRPAEERKERPPLLRFLSSPVSGGTGAAAAGTLTVLAGGPEPSRTEARRYLSPISSKIIAVGDSPGDGDAAKLANNLALAVQMASVAEALSLAARLLRPASSSSAASSSTAASDSSGSSSASRLRPEKMLEVLNECSGRCWSSEVYPPLAELRDGYRGGFAAALMLKDLALAREAAEEAAAAAEKQGSHSSSSSSSSSFSSSSSPTPMGDAAAKAYRACPPGDDFSSIFRHFYGEGKV